MFCVPDQTDLHHYNTKVGLSKNKEWVQIEGVPCKIIATSETGVSLNSFTSCESRIFDVDNTYFKEHYTMIEPDENGLLLLSKYPVPVHVNEFEKRSEITKTNKTINNLIKNPKITQNMKKIFEDKLSQIISSQGAPYITLLEYTSYKENKIQLTKHKRFGNEIFNRNTRWCPPVSVSYEEFQASKSYPAPLGIRPKDFCLPSELIETLHELVNQIANFRNVSQIEFEEIEKELKIHKRDFACCKYCGESIDISQYNSEYKSSDNFMEICHRNPNERFIVSNMYWGHGECNRRQGGYSENERMKDGFVLALLNKK